jgi:sulfide:quinone oxidoreductase
MRDRVELVYVTPLDGAFTKPVAPPPCRDARGARHRRRERLHGRARRPDAKALVSFDEREVPFDLLVTVPLNMGADFVARSGLGDQLNYVPVDKHTNQSRRYPNVFALGDATDLPTSKAGSTAHFSVDVFTENFLEHARGRPMTHAYDGHANCFVESGDGKGLLLDFNYETQPLPGRYPLPGRRPFALLEETDEPRGQADVQVGVLARPAARPRAAAGGRHEPRRQAPAGGAS